MQLNNLILSKRTFWFNSDKDDNVLFIGNTNSFICFSKNEKQLIENQNFDKLNNDKIQKMIESGALVENEKDLENRCHFLNQKNNNSFQINLWILVTDLCNFNCRYCFEHKEDGCPEISINVIEAIITFLTKFKNLKRLNINFSGGEPLLCIDKILLLYEKIRALGIETSYGLITNGYLLNKTTIEKLSIISRLKIQITLDGMGEVHNLRRPHKINKDCFSQIIQNMDDYYSIYHKTLTPELYPIIRVNVDKENMNNIFELVSFLHQRYNNFFNISLYPVKEFETPNKTIFNYKEFSEFCLKIMEKDETIRYQFYPRFRIPGGYCTYNRIYDYTISANGDLYKCPFDVGVKTKIIRNLITGELNPAIEWKYLSDSDIFSDEECTNCLFLFDCLGGCPKSRENNKKECIPAKYFPAEYLKYYYESILKTHKK